ncbi:response regulator [Oleispirillum naphthae]|uniref:response regulator n=1 Tax=Oleispirillum naphthae TaxID=2838853 RepID=UPI003082578A
MNDICIPSVKFIVVDDRSLIRRIVRQHLESRGIDLIDLVCDGQEALDLLKFSSPVLTAPPLTGASGLPPDDVDDSSSKYFNYKTSHTYCVITDFSMPNLNGLQLVKAIRCGETGIPRDTPIILLTGYSDEYIVSTALSLDVNAFVPKPVSHDVLWEKVECVLTTEVPVKEVSAYATVEIPDESGKVIEDKSDLANLEIVVDDQTLAYSWIPLDKVKSGTVLAGSLRNGRGDLLFRQGMVISEDILHKLMDIKRTRGFSGKIPITKSPKKG